MTNRTSTSRKRAISGVISLGLAASVGLAGCGGDEAPVSKYSTTSFVRPTMSPEEVAAQNAANEKFIEDSKRAAAEKAEQDRLAREAAAVAAAAKFDRNTYPTLDARAFALLAKDPDSHIGEKFIAYGHVTQSDAATGTTAFRANTGASPSRSYDYDVNTVVRGAADILAPVIEDDLVTIYAEVAGAYNYDTTMGGSATALELTANIIDVTGTG